MNGYLANFNLQGVSSCILSLLCISGTNPSVLHTPDPLFSQQKLLETDQDILSAQRWHTGHGWISWISLEPSLTLLFFFWWEWRYQEVRDCASICATLGLSHVCAHACHEWEEGMDSWRADVLHFLSLSCTTQSQVGWRRLRNSGKYGHEEYLGCFHTVCISRKQAYHLQKPKNLKQISLTSYTLNFSAEASSAFCWPSPYRPEQTYPLDLRQGSCCSYLVKFWSPPSGKPWRTSGKPSECVRNMPGVICSQSQNVWAPT